MQKLRREGWSLTAEPATARRAIAAYHLRLGAGRFTVPADALPATVSVLTLVGGKVVHEKR